MRFFSELFPSYYIAVFMNGSFTKKQHSTELIGIQPYMEMNDIDSNYITLVSFIFSLII